MGSFLSVYGCLLLKFSTSTIKYNLQTMKIIKADSTQHLYTLVGYSSICNYYFRVILSMKIH